MTPQPHALIPYLEDCESWSFGYGREPKTHDCARFCGAGVEAVHGLNPLRRFSSEWTTLRGARRVLARHSGMAAAVSEVMSSIPVTLAQRGDVGLTADNALVLVEGEMVVGLDLDRGLVRQPRSAMTMAWSVRA